MLQLLHLAAFILAQRLSASSEFAHPTCASVHEFSNSAQRLSASSEFALSFVSAALKRRSQCSTPFGIIGIRTTRFRKESNANNRAQRLSASSEFAPGGWHEDYNPST